MNTSPATESPARKRLAAIYTKPDANGRTQRDTLLRELREKGWTVSHQHVRSEEDQIQRGLVRLPAVDIGSFIFYGITEIRAYLGVALVAQQTQE